MESEYYPLGAEFDSNAPYNQIDLPKREIEVTISVTLSKTMRVMVDDYSVEEGSDEDGRYLSYDYSECDLHKAVENQIVLPQNLAEFTKRMFDYNPDLKAAKMPKNLKDAIEDCRGWCVDDFECILD